MKNFRQIIQYNPDLGHKYVPNQFARLKYGNDGYFIETDERGFRNSPLLSIENKTILVLGDSFTAGDGVENSFRFSDLIQKELRCNVINLAVSGYGVDQQLLVYERYKDEIKHDLVIIVPHLDDLKRNLVSERIGINKFTGKPSLIPKPYFRIEKDRLVLKNVPVPKVKEDVNNQSENDVNEAFVGRTRNYLNRRFLNKRIHPEFENANSEEWKLMNKILERLKVSISEKPLLIVPLPYYDSVTYKEKPKFLELFKKHESSIVHVLDVVSILNEQFSLADNRIFLPLCGHFTQHAHELIAAVIKNFLLKIYSFEEKVPTSIEKANEDEAEYILGISCLYHDSAAALIKNGVVIAAAQEERFSRIKHDKSFPVNAINYCLEEGRIAVKSIKAVVYYDIETWTIERVLHNSLAIGNKGSAFWDKASESLFNKLKLPSIIRQKINYHGQIFKTQHHISHAAGAFYTSPFSEAAILIIDGVGEWACSTIASGEGAKITIHQQQYYPHSLGLLYSAITYFCGFKVNSGEYKLMGLAPYGKPIYVDLLKENVVDIKEDGSIFLNMNYFSFLEGERMTNENFATLIGGIERTSESEISKREMDLAASIQVLTEEIVVKMANHAYSITGKKFLVMSGGVALNCVSNGKLFNNTQFEDIYFQPASGDAGGAIGCALNWYFENSENPIKSSQPNPYLGPSFSNDEILAYLETKGIPYNKFINDSRAIQIASFAAKNNIIGHFDGRMEFGPRALGNRSIIANPMDVEMQSKINLKIKFRESFRPFAPIYSEERTKEYFDFDRPSPYMLVVRNVKKDLLTGNKSTEIISDNMIEIINQKRSEIPAITHVDNSARLQSINEVQNKRFHDILLEFEKIKGKAILVNTSFNVRSEPIVCSINDAYTCFMRTDMDILVLNDFYLVKSDQPEWKEFVDWKESFELD